MHTEPLDVVPIWLLFFLSCLIGWLALEGGYRLGKWRHARSSDEKEAPVGAMVASILGLLAFMLAFTFGLAATRFDTRRQLVLEEANAVGTTYLRARLLPAEQREDEKETNDNQTKDRRGVLTLLKVYVDERIRGINEGRFAETITISESLHEKLWQKAVDASKNNTANPVMTSLFIQSLNEMIDLHAKRVQVGMRNRIPITVWTVLFAFAMLGMSAVGYQAGLSGTRRSPAMLGMVLAFAAVLFLIADLDRGRVGFLEISQQALVDLQNTMRAGS